VPVVLWASQRSKSRYAAFQALQAYGYQSLGYTVYMLFVLLICVLVFVALFVIALFFPDMARSESTSSTFALILMVFIFAALGLYLLLPVLAAILCGLGQDFHYPLLGNRLAAFLRASAKPIDEATPALDPAAEARWLAAMGHFAVIQPFWGLVAPLYLWLSEGRRDPYLKFQSAQTVFYQALVNVFSVGTLLLSFLALVVTMGLISVTNLMNGEGAALSGLFVMTCCLGLGFTIIPLFHILGQWAGLRVLQGHNFYYPLLGRWVDDWLKRGTPPGN
jgi:uncharacterized Tic20 family protein